MMIFLKWSSRLLLIVIFMAGLTMFVTASGSSEVLISWDVLIPAIMGPLILGAVCTFIEIKYFPQRRSKIVTRLMRLFNASPVSDNVVTFRFYGFDFYASVDFSLTGKRPDVESIVFHIPRQQIDHLLIKPDFNYHEDVCNGLYTYAVYHASGGRLKSAKRRLTKKLSTLKKVAIKS